MKPSVPSAPAAVFDTKPRYEILDGLRGVAALLVIVFHLTEFYAAGPEGYLVGHGYLAVDFFFVLSGFVVGYAYDDRWGRMSLGQFFKRRIIRLHPMLIAGTLFGVLCYFFGAAFPSLVGMPWWRILLVMLFCCTILPAPRSWDLRGWGETNPLNGPAWSLQWEYAANILYALFFRRMRRRVLALWVALFGVLTLLLTLNIDLFGLLARRAALAYTVIGGWSLTPTELYIGATRLLYPFFAGLLLSRTGRIIRLRRNGFGWCAAAIVVLLCMPHLGGSGTPWLNGLYECLCILVLFPTLVAAGAGSSLNSQAATKVCRFLGAISYPLYITHYPLIYMHAAFVQTHPDAPTGTHVMLCVSVVLLALFNAWALMKLVDTPVRQWLTQHWLKQPAKPREPQQQE